MFAWHTAEKKRSPFWGHFIVTQFGEDPSARKRRRQRPRTWRGSPAERHRPRSAGSFSRGDEGFDTPAPPLTAKSLFRLRQWSLNVSLTCCSHPSNTFGTGGWHHDERLQFRLQYSLVVGVVVNTITYPLDPERKIRASDWTRVSESSLNLVLVRLYFGKKCI